MITPNRARAERTIRATKKQGATMNQYFIPTYPAVGRGRYIDQDDYADDAHRKISEMIIDENFDCYFGVVEQGMGGGYLVDFAEDWFRYPIQVCVFLVKPQGADTATLADVAALPTWAENYQRLNALSECDGWDCRDVPVKWAFEFAADARAWLALEEEFQERAQ